MKKKKKSYERRAYESVDEKSQILGYFPKNDEKKNLVHKGLILFCSEFITINSSNDEYRVACRERKVKYDDAGQNCIIR